MKDKNRVNIQLHIYGEESILRAVPRSTTLKSALVEQFERAELAERVESGEWVVISGNGFMRLLTGPLDHDEQLLLRPARVAEKIADKTGTVVIVTDRDNASRGREMESVLSFVGHECWLLTDCGRIKRVLRSRNRILDNAAVIWLPSPRKDKTAEGRARYDGFYDFLWEHGELLTVAAYDRTDDNAPRELRDSRVFVKSVAYPGSDSEWDALIEYVNSYFVSSTDARCDRIMLKYVRQKTSVKDLKKDLISLVTPDDLLDYVKTRYMQPNTLLDYDDSVMVELCEDEQVSGKHSDIVSMHPIGELVYA